MSTEVNTRDCDNGDTGTSTIVLIQVRRMAG